MGCHRLNIVLVILTISANVVRSHSNEGRNASQVCFLQSGYTFHCESQNLRRVPLIPSNTATLHLERNIINHLTTRSFKQYTSLLNLHLDNNGITLLYPSWAINLPKLREITLCYNHLTSLHENTFDGLFSLRSLNLKNNEIMRVWEGWCIGLISVVKLDLSYNRLAYIDHNNWCSFSRLESLDLSHNKIAVLGSRWSEGMRTLSVLYLQDNVLRQLQSQMLTSLNSLEKLFLQNNLIVNIEEGWSSDLNSTRFLNLSHNKLETMEENFFHGMTKATWINLKESNIRLLQNDAFRMMTNVLELILERNFIQQISTDAFKDLSSVRRLRLQYNDIHVLQPGSFAGMMSLLRLYLQNNEISVILKGTFTGLFRLTHLYLSHNNISSLEHCWGGDFEKLQYLDLSWNNIIKLRERNFICNQGNALYTTNSRLGPSSACTTLCENATVLQTLILSGNPIGYGLAIGAFQGLPKLWHLLLDNCNLVLIVSEQFTGLNSLRLLDISFNKIVSLDSYAFRYLPSLVAINAKHNLIVSLGPGTLNGTALMYADLRSNNIETISSSTFRLELGTGLELYIANNPLLCDHRLKWIQQVIDLEYIRQVDLSNISTQNLRFRSAIADVSDAVCANLHGIRLCDVPSRLLPPYVPIPTEAVVINDWILTTSSATFMATFMPHTRDIITPDDRSFTLTTAKGMSNTNGIVRDVTYDVLEDPNNNDDGTKRLDNWLSQDQRLSYFVMISICVIICILVVGKCTRCFKCWRKYKESLSEGNKFQKYHKIRKRNLQNVLSTLTSLENTTKNNSTCANILQKPVSVSPPLHLNAGIVSAFEKRQPPPPPPRRNLPLDCDIPPPIPSRITNQEQSTNKTTVKDKSKIRHTYFCDENSQGSLADPALAEDAMQTFLEKPKNNQDIHINVSTNQTELQQDDLKSEGARYNRMVTEALVHEYRCSDLSSVSLENNSSGNSDADPLIRGQRENAVLSGACLLVEINSTDEETLGSSFSGGDMERDLDNEEQGQSDLDDFKSTRGKQENYVL